MAFPLFYIINWWGTAWFTWSTLHHPAPVAAFLITGALFLMGFRSLWAIVQICRSYLMMKAGGYNVPATWLVLAPLSGMISGERIPPKGDVDLPPDVTKRGELAAVVDAIYQEKARQAA
ncbi:hypothetical protein BH09SUM1_BH09SUM1_18470 [soil metagenome]